MTQEQSKGTQTQIATNEDSLAAEEIGDQPIQLTNEQWMALINSPHFKPISPKLDKTHLIENMTKTYNYIWPMGQKIRIPVDITGDDETELIDRALVICQRPSKTMFTTESDVPVFHKYWIATVQSSFACPVIVGWIKHTHLVMPVCVIGFSPWHIKVIQEGQGILNPVNGPSSQDVIRGISDYKDSVIMRLQSEVASLRRQVNGLTEGFQKVMRGEMKLLDLMKNIEAGIFDWPEKSWIKRHVKGVVLIMMITLAVVVWLYVASVAK